ncbi:ribose-phosphate diphosphokinase [Candidatus Uhrbacteria bacterium]|nr:ribose-phosphate diphosphokinase [Candidatus Uhrbacteria bacterium]
MRPVILFSVPAFEKQAETIVGKSYEVRSIRRGRVSWGRFPDKFPDLLIEGMESMSQCHAALLLSITTPEVVFEQISVFYALAARRPASLRLLLPYFPTGTMERIDYEGQVATAHTLAQMLSAAAPSGPGPIPLYIWDAHALSIRHYFGPNIAPRFKSGVKRLTEENRLDKDDVIVFPDEGAWKRFKIMFSDSQREMRHPFSVCRKVRLHGKRMISLQVEDVAGKHAVIVDDLIHSGGTILECKKALDQAGATKVSVFITHAVMENEAWKKFLDAGFEKIWITDSIPETASAIHGQKPFEVVSLVDSMRRAILDGLDP